MAALLLAVAALCLWASSRMTWVTVTSADGLGEERITELDGGTWAAATTPLALALIAAIAAAFAVRGWLLRVVGLLVAVVAVVAAIPAVGLLVGGASDEKASDIAGFERVATQVTATEVATAPALLVLVGSVVAFGAAFVLIRKPSAAGGLSRSTTARRRGGRPPPSGAPRMRRTSRRPSACCGTRSTQVRTRPSTGAIAPPLQVSQALRHRM